MAIIKFARRADASEANGLRNLKCRDPLKWILFAALYELWEEAGKPDGRDQEFYHQAEQELQSTNEQAIPETVALMPLRQLPCG